MTDADLFNPIRWIKIVSKRCTNWKSCSFERMQKQKYIWTKIWTVKPADITGVLNTLQARVLFNWLENGRGRCTKKVSAEGGDIRVLLESLLIGVIYIYFYIKPSQHLIHTFVFWKRFNFTFFCRCYKF